MSQDYTQKSAKNAIISVVTQLLSNVIGFVSRYVFIRCLSVEYLGINGLFANVLTLLSFAELGIGEALVYAMYKPMKDKDYPKLSALLSFYKNAYRWIALFIFSVGLLLSFFIDGFVVQKPDIPENFQLIFCLFLLNNAASYFMVYKQSVLMVDQNKYIASLVKQTVYVVQVILQIIFLIYTHNYYIFLLWQITGTITTNLCLTSYVNKHYPWARNTNAHSLEYQEKKKIFRDIKTLSISKIAGVVSNGADNIIIARLLNLTSVGLVSNYSMVIGSLNGLLWGMLSSITGSIGQFNVYSELEKKRAVFSELYLLTFWLYSCLCIGLITMLSPLVTVWLGKEFIVNNYVVIALVAIVYVSGLNFPFYSFRVTHGMFEPMKYNYLYFGILNVVLSIVFGKRYGLLGVYAATTFSRLVAAELKEGFIVYRKILNLPFRQYITKYVFSAILMFSVCMLTWKVVELIPLNGWSSLILRAVFCLILINVVYVLAFFKTKAFRELSKKFKKIIKK